jgi:hypothetical protein
MLEKVYAAVSTNVVSALDTTTYGTLGKIFGVAMNVVIGVAVSLAVIFIGLGGIKYITSHGDAKAADAARSMLTNAVIGLLVALGALLIKFIIMNSILNVSNTAIDNSLTF